MDPKSFSSMPLLINQPKMSDILAKCAGFKKQVKNYHCFRSAALIAGLLTDPQFQANTIRLETLIHILIAFSGGKRQPSPKTITSWLNEELGGTVCARLEDPVEDVFISNVTNMEGNFRIFEGVWESSDFYLQRILNIIETLPNNKDAYEMKRSVRALLLLSEEIANRRSLFRFISGGGTPKANLTMPSLERLQSLRRTITFTSDDLKRLQISGTELTPFVLQERHQLCNQSLGESSLERHPIVWSGGDFIVILPTAISMAVRQFFLGWIASHGYQTSFDEHLVREYHKYFCETPVLGQSLPTTMPLPPQKIFSKSILEFAVEIDAGRYIQVIGVVDSIKDYLDYGLESPDESIVEVSNEIKLKIKYARSSFRKKSGFRQGLTLVVGCGYGRPRIFHSPKETSDWRIEFISAPDLATIGMDLGVSKLSLWKLIDYERFLGENGIIISNVNGLLNLYGWWSETEFLMLHPSMKFGDPINLIIPTDCQKRIRTKVRQGWDVHGIQHPSGSFFRMQKFDAEYIFPGEANKPRYASMDAALDKELLGAWVGETTVWWIKTEQNKTKISRDLIYRIWDACNNWMERISPVCERSLKPLNEPAIMIVLDFTDAYNSETTPATKDVLRSSISISTDQSNKTIRLSFKDAFFGGFRHPTNIAEWVLIEALIKGVLSIIGEDRTASELDILVNEIVPNQHARYVHFFEAIHFRDYIRLFDRAQKIIIDTADEVRSKLGLGWAINDSTQGNTCQTAENSRDFLNRAAIAIWNRMKSRLCSLNRLALIERALRHIEGCQDEQHRWERTFRAAVALREDRKSTNSVAIEHISRFKASQLALRLVIEMAISECPIETGDVPGELDLTPLMSDILLMFHLGGCSDAITKGVMDPHIQITPWGDILTHFGFLKGVTYPEDNGHSCLVNYREGGIA